MTDFIKTQCDNCENLLLFGCKAFKNIPDEILSGKIKHDKVLKGQKGNYIFTPKERETKK